jgi:multicomponent Na+:H+ antiporter subunit D
MSGSAALVLAVLIPVLGSALIASRARAPAWRDGALVATAILLFATIASLLPDSLAGAYPATEAWEIVPGLALQLALEPLGMLFALIASGLWVVNAVYAIGYMRANDEPRQAGFHACFALALAATMGVACAANLFTLFLFYELLTLVTYPLVTHGRDRVATRAGRSYLLLLLGGSLALFLPAIAWVYVATGNLDFTAGGVLGDTLGPGPSCVLLVLFALGVGKAALMPLHRWLPAAMVAPAPVSALLHAVAVVKAGVFAIVKIIVYTLGIETLSSLGAGAFLQWLAGFTVIAASVIALRQDDLKRRLAYSTISQLAMVVLAAAILTPLSIAAAALHIAAHALGKITLFFAAGAFYTTAHKIRVGELDGIGRRMPVTTTAFAIGALSMIGVPPTIGFIGKWYIVAAAFEAGQFLPLGVVILSTVLNAAYFLPIVIAAFLRPPTDDHAHGEAPWSMLLALCLTAALSLAFFAFPALPLALARQLASFS